MPVVRIADAKGREFFKMTGSGNDFVVLDARARPAGALAEPQSVRQLCARRTGVGADGLVLLQRSSSALFAIVYYNSDGSRASLCGNAALCSVRLAHELEMAAAEEEFVLETDAGTVRARVSDGQPEIELQPAESVREDAAIATAHGETRLGFALVGVPHLVVRCRDVSEINVAGRGAALRSHPSLRDGANVNFVSKVDGGWAMRTFERGVEAETLACGTGAVASAILIARWTETHEPRVSLLTQSGRSLTVTIPSEGAGGPVKPKLRGEGRLVFRGVLAEV